MELQDGRGLARWNREAAKTPEIFACSRVGLLPS